MPLTSSLSSFIFAAKVLVAMGPWSVHAEEWFGLRVPQTGIRSTSMVYQVDPARPVDPFALFCSEDSQGCHLEVYPRPDSTVYLCGLGGSVHLSPRDIKGLLPQDVVADPERVAAAHTSFAAISSLAQGLSSPTSSQACLRPCPDDALPLLGAIPGWYPHLRAQPAARRCNTNIAAFVSCAHVCRRCGKCLHGHWP